MSITYFIIGLTCLISVLTFSNHSLFDKLVFWPYQIWRNSEWYRLVSCGFIHADVGHLFFNMFALYSFGSYVEVMFQVIFPGKGLLIYISMNFIAIATADILNLFSKRDNPEYRSLGASGGVSAVVFSSILLDPFGKIGIMFIPVPIPAYIFGVLYLIYCAYMAKRGRDNIGHTAHFTGSIFGFFFPVLFQPSLLTEFISKVTNHM